MNGRGEVTIELITLCTLNGGYLPGARHYGSDIYSMAKRT